MSTTVTTNTVTTAQSALDRAASEKRLQELLAAQLRLAEMNKKGSTNTILGKAPTDTADAKTLAMLITIGTTLILAFMGLIFMVYYKNNRVLVLVASCVYIALYGAFVMYVTNQVDQDDCFQDKTSVLLLKGSTIMVLFVAIMIALATVLLPLIEPKKPDGPGGHGGPGGPGGPNGQGGPGRQFNNQQQNGDLPGGRRGRNRGNRGFDGPRNDGFQGPRNDGFQGPRNDGFRGNNDGFQGRNDGFRGNNNGFRGNNDGFRGQQY